MSQTLPIACSLDASELEHRLAEMADVGRLALIDARVDGRHAHLRFSPTAQMRERLDAIVAAESTCCAFLTLRLEEAPGVISLTIDAPETAEPVVRELVDAFVGAPAR
jgi:hypothetical protein